MVLSGFLGSMGANALSGHGGNGNWVHKWVLFALLLSVLTPMLMGLLLSPSHEGEWADVEDDMGTQYQRLTGRSASADMNIWTLKGIYTPFSGGEYGWTEDGWLYGQRVKSESPSQYQESEGYPGSLQVRQAENGIWYYVEAPDAFADVVPAQWDGDKVTNPKEATVYTSVCFDNAHKSDVYFTPGGKTETDEGYYYEYTGYRYAFGPLSDYNMDVSGRLTEVKASSTSLSLIWYQYSTLSGIAGQLTISGSDSGLAYLTSDDIVRAFNSTTYTSKFDMTFNGVQMHLVIRMDPVRLALLSPAQCYDNGYWSVLVYSDAVAASMSGAGYNFSLEDMVGTFLDIFSFRLDDKYDISGWEATLVSLLYSLVLYSVILVICLDHPIMYLGVGLLALIQAAIRFLGSGLDVFGGLFG